MICLHEIPCFRLSNIFVQVGVTNFHWQFIRSMKRSRHTPHITKVSVANNFSMQKYFVKWSKFISYVQIKSLYFSQLISKQCTLMFQTFIDTFSGQLVLVNETFRTHTSYYQSVSSSKLIFANIFAKLNQFYITCSNKKHVVFTH